MERVEMSTEAGTVYVEVLSAVERSFHDSSVAGQVTRVYPVLRVTTYPNGPYEAPEFLKLKGKRYSADLVYAFEGWPERPWSSESRDNVQRYVKTEAGNSLEWRSPSGKTIHALMDGVRDEFVAAHPEWVRESKAMRLRWQIKHAEGLATQARAETAKQDALAAELRAELEAL